LTGAAGPGNSRLPQAEPRPSQRSRITPGSFFLRLATDGEPFRYAHTGIVVDAAADTFKTIEGNTNDDGSHEGYEVCARVRGYAGIDVVVMEAPLLKRERQGSGDCGTAARPPRLPLRE
jgi:hypothetical protein